VSRLSVHCCIKWCCPREETTREEMLDRPFPIFTGSFKVFDELLACNSSRLQRPEFWLFWIEQIALKLSHTAIKVWNCLLINLQMATGIFTLPKFWRWFSQNWKVFFNLKEYKDTFEMYLNIIDDFKNI